MGEQPKEARKLSLVDAVAMAIGGMVGGGIFAVLGQAATAAGNGAFIAFAGAGALALITGLSYGRLTVSYDEPGGSFSYVEELAGRHAAGTLSWFLLAGYLFTNGLYAYTFGAYGGRLLGRGPEWTPFLGSGILIALAGLNMLGVQASAKVEDVVVYGKVLLLILLTAVGATTVRSSEALPLVEGSSLSVLTAGALVFVGYEGFQLLTYDYDDIEHHERNVPKAIWMSILLVTVLYVLIAFVLTGSVDADTISQQAETVLADVAEPRLGRAGLVMVLVAAVLSTSSAINATLFSTGRLARRVAADGQLPRVLTSSTVHGVPVWFLTGQVALAVLLLFTADLEQIVTFSSLVFLVVFGVVNAVAVWHGVFEGWQRALPVSGALGCAGAAVALGIRTARDDPAALGAIGIVALVLMGLRALYQWLGDASA